MRTERVGFALCGSFCTHEKALTALKRLTEEYETVIPIVSENAAFTDTRFGTSDALLEQLEELTGHEVLYDIPSVEPLGPKGMIDGDAMGQLRPLHRQHTGEAGPWHHRYNGDHGGQIPSAVRQARGDRLFHQ